ncbi:centromere protein J-like isoform X2 [Dunckerocampus dactyliophorus]|nr:centromere protein J-like isoform X2 [Dunckerocampus dactyliophorus]
MPSSTTSSVTINPGPDLAESLRYTSPSSTTPRPPHLETYEDDTNASDFASLRASVDAPMRMKMEEVAAKQSPRPKSPDGQAVARLPREPLVEKLQRWKRECQLESIDLGEFELEQAAELYLSSTFSFVTKVLQMDQQNRKLLGVAGPDQRRFSSMPIKPPPTTEQRRSPGSHGDGGRVVVKKSKVRFDDGEDSTSTATALKEQLSSPQEEQRKKESCWSCTHARLRQQIDSLSQENFELKGELFMLEMLRLRAERDTTETSKMQRECKLLEKHPAAVRAMPNKKERR